MKPAIFLDMDGVLAGFEDWSQDVIGPDWKAEIDQPEWGAYQNHPRLYSKLPIMQGADVLYATCCKIVGKDHVHILTALPNRARSHFPHAAMDKIQWARTYISPSIKVLFGPFAKDKQHHCRYGKDILIDDMAINIEQWRAAGGLGILHTEVFSTLNHLEVMTS